MIALVVVAVVVILGLAAWAAKSSSDNGPDLNVQTGTSFAEGNCVILASVDGRITPIPSGCSAIGALRIGEVVDLGRPCPSPFEAFDLQADQIRLCLRGS